MKNVILVLAMLLNITVMMAQPPKGGRPEGPPKMNIEQLQEDLNLTDDQVISITELFEQIEETRKASGNSQRPTESERKEMQEMMSFEMKKILTKEQFTQFEKLQEKAPQRGGKRSF